MRIEKRVVHQGKWLRTCVVDFKNEQGKVLKDWEMVERVRMNPDEICNGVDIVPIVKYKNGTRRLLLIANYRPPVDAYVVEFPAGLLDCDDVIENAHRELKEETGYIADEIKLLNFSPVLRVDPWKSNESSKIVVAFIDGDKECNHNPS